ncbi:P-loop NTPase [Dermabacteraceae bacterium P13115]
MSESVWKALARVIDPEIHRPITDLDMVESVKVDGSTVRVHILLTIAGCPMASRIERDVRREVLTLPEVESVEVTMGAMTPEQRQALTDKLKAGRQNHPITFNDPSSLTRVIAVGSGKGGVGKSSVTANLAAAMAAKGLSVGVLDADIHGFSMTRMLGVTKQPTRMDDMLLPPTGNGVKVMSIGSFVPDGQAVVWRGPKMHRALEQFAADVFWGDLDVLLLDLPPGTGDVAISITQLLPTAELVVVTTPQRAAASVAERVGSLAAGVQQKITGVIENMSWLQQPDGTRMKLFGEGGGQEVADALTKRVGYRVPLLGQVPLDQNLREGADIGVPLTVSGNMTEACMTLQAIAAQLSRRQPLAGRRLPLNVA